MLLRMEQLAVQAANGTNSESDRKAINNEVIQLKKEINRVSRTTKFNEQNVFDNNGIIALDVQGIAEDMNFFNSEYDAATGDVKYGGFLFHGRRISWDTIDGKNFGWRELVDEEGNYSKNGKFHEGVWSLNYEGATVNFVLLEEVGKKKGKGLSPEVAAEQLESDVQQIRCVYAAMDSLGVTDDVDAIYAELSRQKV